MACKQSGCSAELQLGPTVVVASTNQTFINKPSDCLSTIAFLLQHNMALHVARHTSSLQPQQARPCRPISLQRRRRLVITPAVLAPETSVATVEASGGYETAVSPVLM
jgi:hypothetical protein